MQSDGRISIRFPDHDYGRGGYFATLCSQSRAPIFGDVEKGFVSLNQLGRIVAAEWMRTRRLRPEVRLDAWVLMPNHLHGIIFLPDEDTGPNGPVGAHGRAPLRRPGRTLGSLIAGFKAASAIRINTIRGTPRRRVWQRGYFERAIRSEAYYEAICRYVLENPLRWELDRLFVRDTS